MTIQAPAHRKRFRLFYNFHFVDPSVARHTPNPAVDMRTVVEINKIRKIVNPYPLDRFPRSPTFMNLCEFITGRPYSGMTVHTSLCGGNRGVRRGFNCVVAVTAIDPKFPCMQSMRIVYRLLGSVSDSQGDRREAIHQHNG